MPPALTRFLEVGHDLDHGFLGEVRLAGLGVDQLAAQLAQHGLLDQHGPDRQRCNGYSRPTRTVLSPSFLVSLAAISASCSQVKGVSLEGRLDAGHGKVVLVVDQAEGVVLGDAAGVNLPVDGEGVQRARLKER